MKHAALLGLLSFALLALPALLACENKEKTAEAPATAVSEKTPLVVAPATTASAHAKLEKFEMPEVRIKDDAETTVKVAWQVPAGTQLNDDAPFRVRWNRSDGLAEAPQDAKSTGSAVKDGYTLKVKPNKGVSNSTLAGEIDLVVCDAVNHSVCLPVRRRVELGFVAAKDAAAEIKVEMPLPAAR